MYLLDLGPECPEACVLAIVPVLSQVPVSALGLIKTLQCRGLEGLSCLGAGLHFPDTQGFASSDTYFTFSGCISPGSQAKGIFALHSSLP